MPALKSVAIGVWINVGARDEGVGQEGISHFLEHMMFKGTRRRSATQISHEIDTLGGEMNAFTTHESTTFYVKVIDQQINQAVDLLADLFHHSRFTPRDIEKEKQIVLEEIRTVKDDPEDYVQELHAKDVLRTHPLGRSILGKPITMGGISRRDLMRYIEEQYHPEKVVVSVAGNFNPKELIAQLNTSFGRWRGKCPLGDSGGVHRRPPKIHGGVFVHHKRLEQVHLCLGFKGIPLGHPERYAANTLNAILGGGVSSRLFQEVREKRGLAYTTYSHLSSYSDGGMLTVYAATGSAEARSVVKVIRTEINKLRKKRSGSSGAGTHQNPNEGNPYAGLRGDLRADE